MGILKFTLCNPFQWNSRSKAH